MRRKRVVPRRKLPIELEDDSDSGPDYENIDAHLDDETQANFRRLACCIAMSCLVPRLSNFFLKTWERGDHMSNITY